MNMTQNITGALLDYLGIQPKSTLLELGTKEPLFTTEAQKRDISCTNTRETDWIIYVAQTNDMPQISQNTPAQQAIVIPHTLSLICYTKWRLSLPVKSVIRIKPAINHQALYMSSANFFETFKRTYKEANSNLIGKCLVGLKVALTPSYSYPMLVFVL